jgi:hypothetical protein
LLKIEAPANVTIAWAFGGVSGRKGRRNGDIGCEVEPVSQFFQLRPEETADNSFSIEAGSAKVRSKTADFLLASPPGSRLEVRDFAAWNVKPSASSLSSNTGQQPILVGSVQATAEPMFLTLLRVPSDGAVAPTNDAKAFQLRSKQVEQIAATLAITSPDPYIDAMGPALGIVADALWDPKQECVMHGCVAWRVALAGWRGPYVLDATGAHDRAKLHFRHWLKKQNVSPITTGDPATGPADPGMHLARKENLLHSNGDISNNHYDMNLVFFDVLLRHLRWTGDVDFAREIWPAFQRHLAWERRLFRRTFTVDGKELPLYEAYAAIWASDNLQYNGGGTAHASAYNVFSHRMAAQLALLLGDDPNPYQREASLINEAMQKLLWLPSQGAFAESKDLMGPQTVYNNPALWTVYHTIDSEVATQEQAWQMLAERLATLKHIPMDGPGVPTSCYMLACSDWLPYMWSLTLVLLSENMHFALAMWQAGMADEAYKIFKGALLDSMYMGLCPGDFHMTSALDSHRQEAQRDFGDPTGIASRALVEGLFGVRPDLLRNTIFIAPGFPSDWTHASLEHPDFDLKWLRDGQTETIVFTSRFPKAARLVISLPAHTTTLPTISGEGQIVNSVNNLPTGAPVLDIHTQPATSTKLTLHWSGRIPPKPPSHRNYQLGQALELPIGVTPAQIYDPQGCLSAGRTSAPGFHTVFARMHQDDFEWSMPISFTVLHASPAFAPIPHLPSGRRPETIDLTPHFTHAITEIFTRSYAEPRSPLCTLSIPDTLLGGWANIDPAPPIDDTGLRRAGGTLKTPLGIPFQTPVGAAPNCILLSYFHPNRTSVELPLSGRASGVHLLVTGTTLPQCSRMEHASIRVGYTDGTASVLSLRNPETWWPIEQDYLLDDYLFLDAAALPPRVSLRSGETRLLTYDSFKGRGGKVDGGAATILYLPLDPKKVLASMRLEVSLYGIVVALMAATLTR